MEHGRGDIIKVWAREILDSRGRPTVEVDVVTRGGHWGRASVPSGASKGSKEAVELRDEERRYDGWGVRRVVQNIRENIAPRLLGWDVTDQVGLDEALIRWDGTRQKSHWGANGILAISMAIARAGAEVCGLPLYRYLGGSRTICMPIPWINLINGGAHVHNGLSIQEFMIVPQGASSFSESLEWAYKISSRLKELFQEKGWPTTLGDEGGLAPLGEISTRETLDLLMQAIEQSHFSPGEHVFLAMDIAGSALFREGFYVLDGRKYSSAEFANFYEDLCGDYPICSLEDPFHEDDLAGFVTLTERLSPHKIQVIGDDIFVTQKELLEKAISIKAGNSILIKMNQVGTITETLFCAQKAHQSGWRTMVSHRSGETEDSFIADLALGVGSGQIKTGALARSERLAKYNRLLRIEEELGPLAIFGI